MDRISKALDKLNQEEKQRLKGILLAVKGGNYKNLDLKKLKGKDNIFRVRKGKMRIIFSTTGNSIKILALERRSDKTYKR